MTTVLGARVLVSPIGGEDGVWASNARGNNRGEASVKSLTSPADLSLEPVREPFADTVPGGTGTTATLALGGSVAVTIDTLGDHDWYSITLTAGTTYTFHTSAFNGTSADSFLRLRNSAGTEIASNDDGAEGTYSLISFTATTTGTYYLDAGTYDDDTTGSFHLSAAAVLPAGADSVAGTTATGATLAVGGMITGNIDTNGDHDFYAITLTAGQTYIFRTGGTTTSTSTDTTLTVRNSAGTSLTTNDDAGEGSFSAIRFTAETTGTYYLDVGGFGSATGAFTLTAFTTPTPVLYTNDQIANQLTNGYWGGSSHHYNVAPGGTITFNVQALTAAGQTLARAALELWTDATGINFSEVTTGGQLVYDDSEEGAYAGASYSNGLIIGSTINIGTDWLSSYGTGLNSYSFQTYIHETGHALGLGHAGNYNGNADYASDSLYLNDSWATTVMSYFDQTENSYFGNLGFTRQYVLTPMVADAIAMAAMHGASSGIRTGNTTYGFNNTSGRSVYDATQFTNVSYTVYDNGGTDTLDYSGYGANQVINLNAETFSNIGGRTGNVSIGRGTVIENAIGGSGGDTITGNGVANALYGNGGADILIGGAGDDVLDGGTGADSMTGGSGEDFFYVDNAGDLVFESSTGGLEADSIFASVSWTLAAGQEIERIRAASGSDAINLTGNEFGQKIQGNNGANVFNGGGGADSLDGGAGADTLNGGTGDDKLNGGDGVDIFAVSAGTGTDRITDFTPGTDRIDVSALGMTWSQVQAALSEAGGHTTLNLGSGNSLVIRFTTISQLSSGDFIVAPGAEPIKLPDAGNDDFAFDPALIALDHQPATVDLYTDWHVMM